MADFLHRYIVAAFFSTIGLILLTIIIFYSLYKNIEDNNEVRKDAIITELNELDSLIINSYE